MRGQHKPGYVRPRKGEKRQQDKPLKVDRLPAEVRDAIQKARVAGRTWAETTEAAAKAAAKLGVKPPSEGAVRRWYDQRIEQVQKEVMAQAERARALAAAFAQRGFKELPEAALAALSSEVFTVMEAGTPGAREASLSNLVFMLSKLIDAQSKQKRAEIEERKVNLAQKKFDELKSKAEKATNEAAAKIGKGKEVTLADINSIRAKFALPPVAAAGH